MLLSITVSASLGRSLLPWTIIEVNEDDYTFETLFTNILGGRFDAVTVSEDLKSARRLQSPVYVVIMTSLEFIFNNNNYRPPACT